MKKLYLKLLIKMASYSCIGLFCQLLLVSLCFAHEAEGQRARSIERVEINTRFSNVSLAQVFTEIEAQTNFVFTFDEKDSFLKEKYGGWYGKSSVANLLRDISLKKGLIFRQSNNNISVKRQPNRRKNYRTRVEIAYTVSGKVTSLSDEIALPGVNILVKGTNTGTVTDIDGNYTINARSENDTLLFSSIGYQTQEVPINGQSQVNVELLDDIQSLNEVVVVGYGTQQKRDLTGAVSQVKASQLENENPNAVQDILRGNIAGLNVGYSSSAKGGGSLQVRGQTTLNANGDPLLVVDGVIYYGALSDINPNDIETIDVLKDASSAAVFGAKAANGVILITTKRGSDGKPTITLNSNFGLATMSVNQPVYGPQEFINWRQDVMQSTNVDHEPFRYADPRNLPSDVSMDEWLGYDGSSGDPVEVWLRRLSFKPVEIQNYNDGKAVDWYDMVFQNGFRQDHTLSLSGKKKEISYYWSLGYLNNEGIYVGDEFTTIRSRLNLEGKITNFLTVGLNTQFANRDESHTYWKDDDPNPNWADWSQIWKDSPWGSEYDEDGNYRFSPQDDPGGGSRHPFLSMDNTDRMRTYNNLISTIYANVDLPFGFSYRLNFSPRFEWYKVFNHQMATHPEWGQKGGLASRQQYQIYNWQLDNIIKWNKTFADIHKFDMTFLINAEKYQSWDNTMSNNGFDPHDRLGFHNMGAGINPIISSNDEVSTGDALMARLFYSLKDRYMVTLSARRDGYSAFGQKNPRAVFGSAALGWVFTEEPFFDSNWLTYGKLRVSWGTNGNRAIGRYASLSDLNTGKYLHVQPDGTVVQVSQLYVNTMSNPNLKWERTTSYNIGLDFTLFDNVLDGTIETYRMSTTDLLVQRSLPDILGFNYVWDNLGEVQNRGIELSLNSTNMSRNNFVWRTTLNFSLNRNKIISLYGDMVDELDEQGNVIGQKEADDFENNWFIGHAIDEIWNYKTQGIWQENQAEQADVYGVKPGDFRVEDVNGDTLFTRADKQFLGFTNPRFRWSMRNEFNIFKNFTFSFLMYSYWGHMSAFNEAKNQSGFMDRNNSYVFPYWTPENPINDYARLYSSNGSASYNIYRKKSLIRLDNVSLAYSFPKTLTNRINLQSLRMYFNVRNAAVFAPDWDYWDPENSGPTPRIYTLGIDLSL